MPNIASLAVSVTARTRGFARGMDRARAQVTGFAGDIASSAARMLKWGAAIGAVAGGGGLGLLLKRSFEYIDATAKVADKLGLATDKLVGLQHAARLAGVESRTFNMGLQRMTRRLSEAAAGTGEAQMALKELRVDAQQLAQLPADQQFRALADAMEGVSNQTDRVRLGFKLFDSEGVALINVLRGGSAALDAMQADAEALGLTFDRIEAAKIEQANNAITRMRGAISGAAQSLAIELAPYVEAATNRLTEMAVAGRESGYSSVDAFEWVTKAAAKLADWLEALKAGFYALKFAASYAMAGVVIAIDYAGKGIEKLLNLIPGVQVEFSKTLEFLWKDLIKVGDEAARQAEESWAAFRSGENQQKVTAFFKTIRDEAQKTAEAAAANQRTGESLSAIGAEFARQQQEMDKWQRLAERIRTETRTPFEVYAEHMENLNKLLELGLINMETFERSAKLARERATEAATAGMQQRKMGVAEQVDLSRIVIGGLVQQARAQKEQKVNDPQLKDVNATLKSIDQKIGKTNVATAA